MARWAQEIGSGETGAVAHLDAREIEAELGVQPLQAAGKRQTRGDPDRPGPENKPRKVASSSAAGSPPLRRQKQRRAVHPLRWPECQKDDRQWPRRSRWERGPGRALPRARTRGLYIGAASMIGAPGGCTLGGPPSRGQPRRTGALGAGHLARWAWQRRRRGQAGAGLREARPRSRGPQPQQRGGDASRGAPAPSGSA